MPRHRAPSTALVACCASLLIAASCQEKSHSPHPRPADSANPGEGPAVSQNEPKEPPFEPQVAGGFYPADRDDLRSMIRGYLDEAGETPREVGGDLFGIIVPHAGYPYSGPVAAPAFVALKGRSYRRVVVLGPAHRSGYRVPALLDAPAYRTPLGDIPIDREGVKKLAATGAAGVNAGKFRGEHALEVELPFLQVALGEFELVPVMISDPDPAAAKKLAEALHETFPGKDTLFVASTDMSHDYPYDIAVAMDENALRYVRALDSEGLLRAYLAHRRAGHDISVGKDGRPDPDCTQLCGMGPVLTLLELAKRLGEAEVRVLDRRNSGDIVGNKKSRIVGYFSAALAARKDRPGRSPAGEPERAAGKAYLDDDDKRELLRIARETLTAYLGDGEKKDFSPSRPNLKKPGAAFVTLKRHGQLRGCIGYMEPVSPLWEMIRDRAIDAATNDSRFQPVKKDELDDISIEISVLTPRLPVENPLEEIVIGRDGVWMEIGRNRGVFLPQVPVEQNWKTVEEYLDHLCRKAHVFQRGCWKSEHARLQRFTAVVFSEKE